MNTETIEKRLQQEFPDSDVVVQDLTGGGSNFDIRIASSIFNGISRIKQHQSVMAVFDEELKSGELHALSIKTISK